MTLSSEDIKEIKYQKRMGIILPVLIFVISSLFLLGYTLYNAPMTSLNFILAIEAGIIGFSFLLNYLMNRKLNKDLALGTKKIKIKKVQEKQDKNSHEAGSGTLHMPILGNLIPKLWSKEMNPKFIMYLVINNYRYEVSKEIYNNTKKGDLIEMHYTQNSNMLIKIDLKKQ